MYVFPERDGMGETYPFIQTLEELDLSIQGIHFGLKLHLAHVSRIHILRESRDPLTSPFFKSRQHSAGNWHPSTDSVTSCLREWSQDQGGKNLTSTQDSL